MRDPNRGWRGLRWAAVAMLVAAGCSEKPSMAPMAVHMREIDKTWAVFLKALDEKGPYHAQPSITQLTGMFQSEVMVGSAQYTGNPAFKKANDDMVSALEKLDSELGQRAMFDVVSSRADVQSLCKNCHGQFWDRAKNRRDGR